MNVRSAALAALAAARGIAPALGMHQVRVVVRTRTYTGGKTQVGPSTAVDLVLGAPDPSTGQILPPHVHGTSGDPELTVGPLTPFDPVVAPRGFTLAQLNPPDAAGVEHYYVVTFPGGIVRPYVLLPHGLDATNPLHITLKLKLLDRKVPV